MINFGLVTLVSFACCSIRFMRELWYYRRFKARSVGLLFCLQNSDSKNIFLKNCYHRWVVRRVVLIEDEVRNASRMASLLKRVLEVMMQCGVIL